MALALPPVLTSLAQISDRYDGYLIDQWGVLHNGVEAYPEAVEALRRLKNEGKSIVILSNSGRTGAENVEIMAGIGIDSSLYDIVLSAGDDAYDALGGARDPRYRDLGSRALVFSRPTDRSMLQSLGIDIVDTVDDADFLFVISMDPSPASLTSWRAAMAQAVRRGLPLVCANPDTTRVNGEGEILMAPGALAQDYEALGGVSFYHGKPHLRIYQTALGYLELPPDKVLAIGDSLDHDVQGAFTAGVDSLFVVKGVHREQIDATRSDSLLAAFAPRPHPPPTWVIDRLRS